MKLDAIETHSSAETSTSEEGLEALAPKVTELFLNGEHVPVRPNDLATLARMSRVLKPALAALGEGEVMADMGDRVLTLFADHAEAVLDACALAVDRPAEWARSLAPKEQLVLATEVFTANADFFVHALLLWLTATRGHRPTTESLSDGPISSNP